MSKDFDKYLHDILERATKIFDHTKDLREIADLEKNSWMQDAIFRNLEVMGEAAKRIPEEYCEKHPEIPWKEIKGTRDRLIHQYSEVSVLIIWDIIKKELQDLIENLERLIDELD